MVDSKMKNIEILRTLKPSPSADWVGLAGAAHAAWQRESGGQWQMIPSEPVGASVPKPRDNWVAPMLKHVVMNSLENVGTKLLTGIVTTALAPLGLPGLAIGVGVLGAGAFVLSRITQTNQAKLAPRALPDPQQAELHYKIDLMGRKIYELDSKLDHMDEFIEFNFDQIFQMLNFQSKQLNYLLMGQAHLLQSMQEFRKEIQDGFKSISYQIQNQEHQRMIDEYNHKYKLISTSWKRVLYILDAQEEPDEHQLNQLMTDCNHFNAWIDTQLLKLNNNAPVKLPLYCSKCYSLGIMADVSWIKLKREDVGIKSEIKAVAKGIAREIKDIVSKYSFYQIATQQSGIIAQYIQLRRGLLARVDPQNESFMEEWIDGLGELRLIFQSCMGSNGIRTVNLGSISDLHWYAAWSATPEEDIDFRKIKPLSVDEILLRLGAPVGSYPTSVGALAALLMVAHPNYRQQAEARLSQELGIETPLTFSQQALVTSSPSTSTPAPLVSGPSAQSNVAVPMASLPPKPTPRLVEMVRLPPGTFMMGSSINEKERSSDERPHEVKLTEGFWMMKTPVTQALWKKYAKNNPSRFSGNDVPVDSVSWFDAVWFANQLSEEEGLEKCYELVGASGTPGAGDFGCREVKWLGKEKSGYRLPTEAEWEYACRAGTKSARYGELDSVAWYGKNSGSMTHKVAEKAANDFGLYDMLGNVWEWCWDYYDSEYGAGAVTDPLGPINGKNRVYRGASWGSDSSYVRATYRWLGLPNSGGNRLGFRLSRRDVS